MKRISLAAALFLISLIINTNSALSGGCCCCGTHSHVYMCHYTQRSAQREQMPADKSAVAATQSVAVRSVSGER
jgi:hypothetical protein